MRQPAKRSNRPPGGPLVVLLFGVASAAISLAAPAAAGERTMALTFDDLPAQRAHVMTDERIAEINDRLLASLSEHEVPAIGFVNEDKLEVDGTIDPNRVELLEAWLDAGLELGNHSYSHPDLHDTPVETYLADVERGERVTRGLLEARGRVPRYFRHPFLHTGTDLDVRRAVESFLGLHGYRVAPVTIDNSEWIFARAYEEALVRSDQALRRRLAESYVDYMVRMTSYYEGQSRILFEREIPQILLLHANAINADHLPALLSRLEERGYRFIDLDTALTDPAYASEDTYTGSGGITWLHRWALTRNVPRSALAGEPTTPEWVQEVAGLRESARR